MCLTSQMNFIIFKNRIKSFENHEDKFWDEKFIELLADSGFFYTGIDDQTQCAYCGLQVTGWKRDDNPLEYHRENNKYCDFFC